MAYRTEDRSLSELLSDVTTEVATLLRKEVELERGQRTTWDDALRRLLAEAGRPVEEEASG